MLHLAVSSLKEGTVGSSEAEVLDILWSLEEMPLFKLCEKEVAAEKLSKKEAKNVEKKSKKDSKKDPKKDKKGKDKSDKKDKVILSPDAKAFKELLKENGDKYKDTLKYARKSECNLSLKGERIVSCCTLAMLKNIFHHYSSYCPLK